MKRADETQLSPAGFAGGQGRTAQEVEDSALICLVCAAGLVGFVLLAGLCRLIGL